MSELAQSYMKPGALSGVVAFVTGGGSGINLGIGKSLAALGADVAICGRTAERLDKAAEELRRFGTRILTFVADVRDYDALKSAMDETQKELGSIRFLVAGAAGNFVAPAEKISANGFKTVLDIDLQGSFNASHAAFDQLKETRGSILFVSAGQSFVPFAFQAHVGAAKAGIDNLMQNLALEWGRFGIRCNSIVPGPIEDTKGMEVLGGASAQDLWKPMIPLGRMGRKDEIGAMAAFLASPMATFISGARIAVDGGQNLTGSALFNHAVTQQLG